MYLDKTFPGANDELIILIFSDTTRTSIHPRISTIPAVQSFYLSGSSTYTLNGTYSFVPQNEIIYQDQFQAGVKNAVSEKIRIISSSLAPGNCRNY